MLLESDACFACCKALGRCLVELPSGISDISLEGKTDSGTPISDPISRGKLSRILSASLDSQELSRLHDSSIGR